MTQDQIVVLAILAATVILFLWGRWRHDMVAAASLLACVAAGLVAPQAAFEGFGHPAVITVACVLVLSRALQATGAVDSLTRRLVPGADAGPTLTIGALACIAAVLSAFMNNVGALALLMPVALQVAKRQQLAPGKVLMPLAFGSILGGMTTLIGTPPNLIVSGFRVEAGDGSFAMFDFAPVGLAVAAAGLLFIVAGGWRLVPARERPDAEGFDTGAYLTEAKVPEKGKLAGKTLQEAEDMLDETEAQIVGLVRHDTRMTAPSPTRRLRVGDILVIEAEPEALASAISGLGLKLVEDVHPEKNGSEAVKEENDGGAPEGARSVRGAGESSPLSGGNEAGEASGKNGKTDELPEAEEDKENNDKDEKKNGEDSDITLTELAVLPDSHFIGRSATDVRLRTRYNVNLLAISRQGHRSTVRLRVTPVRAGDVLLVQGSAGDIAELAAQLGCVPLAERELRIPDKKRALLAAGIMAAAVGAAAFGLVPAAVGFAAGMLASMAFKLTPLRTAYQAIDWPVIVLLGALIPVAGALASTGAADFLARGLVEGVAQGRPLLALGIILVVTMMLSDGMNNAATAAVMCPIAIGMAQQLGVASDPFLMAVAVGASCAFLTPIGHQNNTLILGPGGFRFGDYWRLGLPLEILIVIVGVPMIAWVWPL